MNEIRNHGKKWLYWFVLGVAIIAVYKALDNFGDVMGTIKKFCNIITPFFAGIFISYLLYMPCRKIEEVYRKSKLQLVTKKARSLSILTVYLVIIILLMILINFILPVVLESVIDLINNIQNYYEIAIEKYNHLPERAIFANNNKADMVVRVHADSLNDSGKTGASILIPAKESKYTTAIYEDSKNCANLISDKMKEAGIKVNGIFERGDLTGFNWSQVPVVLVEMGFLSNYNEDQMMSNPEYQRKLMQAISNGLDEYFTNK